MYSSFSLSYYPGLLRWLINFKNLLICLLDICISFAFFWWNTSSSHLAILLLSCLLLMYSYFYVLDEFLLFYLAIYIGNIFYLPFQSLNYLLINKYFNFIQVQFIKIFKCFMFCVVCWGICFVLCVGVCVCLCMYGCVYVLFKNTMAIQLNKHQLLIKS